MNSSLLKQILLAFGYHIVILQITSNCLFCRGYWTHREHCFSLFEIAVWGKMINCILTLISILLIRRHRFYSFLRGR